MAYNAKMFVDGNFAVQHQYETLELAKDWVALMKHSYETDGADMKRFRFTIDTV